MEHSQYLERVGGGCCKNGVPSLKKVYEIKATRRCRSKCMLSPTLYVTPSTPSRAAIRRLSWCDQRLVKWSWPSSAQSHFGMKSREWYFHKGSFQSLLVPRRKEWKAESLAQPKKYNVLVTNKTLFHPSNRKSRRKDYDSLH